VSLSTSTSFSPAAGLVADCGARPPPMIDRLCRRMRLFQLTRHTACPNSPIQFSWEGAVPVLPRRSPIGH